MLEVYSELVQNEIFTLFYQDVDVLYSLWFDVWKSCPYHNVADHIIEKCLSFRHKIINIGKIQVESVPRG